MNERLKKHLEALALDPGNATALRALEEAYFLEGQWADLLTLYEGQWLRELPDTPKAEIALKMARLYEGKLEQLERAIEFYQHVCQLSPKNAQAFQRLWDLLFKKKEFALALQVGELLEPLLKGRPADLLKYFRQVFSIYLGEWKKPEMAFDVAEKILEVAPIDEEALNYLEWHAVGKEVWEGLLAKASRWLEQAMDPKRKEEIRFLQAFLLARPLARPQEAQKILRALGQSTGRLQKRALILLAEVEEARKEYAAAADNLLLAANLDQQATDRLDLLSQAARMQSEKAGNADRAFALWRKVFESNAAIWEAFQYLRETHRQARNWRELVEVLARHTQVSEDVDVNREAFLEMGDLFAQHLRNPDKAIRCYERVLVDSPLELQALLPLLELVEQKGDLVKSNALTDELEKLAIGDQEQNHQAFIALHLHRARHHQGRKETAQALLLYRQVLQRDPTIEVASRGIDHLLRESGAWAELATFLESRADLPADFKERADRWWKIAALYQSPLGDEGATVVALRRCLEAQPDHPKAFELLEVIFRKRENWGDLLHLCLKRVDGVTDLRTRFQLYREIGKIWEERLGDLEKAFEAYRQAGALHEDFQIWGDLARTAEALGRPKQALEFLDKQLALLTSEQLGEALALRRQALAILSGRPDDEETQLARRSHLAAVVAFDPSDASALGQLEDLYRRAGKFRELAELLKALLKAIASPNLRFDVQLRLAATLEEDGRPQEAVAAWDQARRLEPGNLKPLKALYRLHLAANDWEKALADGEALWRTYDGSGAPPEAIALGQELALIAEERLHDLPKATAFWESVLRLASEPAPLEETRRTSLDALERLTRQGPNPRAYAEVLKLQAQSARNAPERIAFLNRLAILYLDSLGDPEQGLDILQQSFAADPKQPEVIQRLQGVLRERRQMGQLADFLKTLIEAHVLTAGEELQKRIERAQLLAGEIGDVKEAESAYDDLLLRDPENRLIYAQAVAFFRQHGNQNKEAATLKGLAALLREHAPELRSERLEVLSRLLEVASSLSPSEKRSLVEEWMGEGGDAERGLASLEEIARIQGDWLEVERIFQRRLERAKSAAARKPILLELARHAHEQLLDFGKARQYREQVVELPAVAWEEADIPWLEDLVEYDRSLEDQAPFRRVGGALSELYAACRIQSARSYELNLALGQSLAEGRYFERALEIWQRQERTQRDPSARERLFKPLAVLWQAKDAKKDLARLYALEAEAVAEKDERCDLLLAAAELSRQIDGDPQWQAELYAKILQERPLDEQAFHSLETYHRDRHAWQELINLYENRSEHELDLSKVASWQIQAGRIWDNELKDPLEASLCYQKALELAPPESMDRPVFERLEEIYRRHENWGNLVKLLALEAERTKDGERRIGALSTQAQICEERLHDLPRAAAIYRRISEENPRHVEGLRSLARLAIALEEYAEAEKTLGLLAEQLLSREEVPLSEAVRVLEQRAELLQTQLNRPADAISVYENILHREPGHGESLKQLRRLYTAVGDWESLARIFEEILNRVEGPSERLTLLFHLSEVYLEKLRDPERGAAVLERILAIDPDQRLAQESLLKLLRGEKRFEDLLQAERRFLERAEPGSQPLRLQRIVEILENPLGRPAEAWPYLLRLAKEFQEAAAGERLVQLAAELKDPARLAESLRLRLEAELKAEERAQHQLELAKALLTVDRERHAPEAAALLEQVLEASRDLEMGRERPLYRESLGLLVEHYEESAQGARLLELLPERVSVESLPARRTELLFSLALLREKMAVERDLIIDAYDKAAESADMRDETRHTRERALTALARLLDPDEHTQELEKVYDGLLEIAQDPGPWRLALGQLLVEKGEGEKSLKKARRELEEVVSQRPLEGQGRHLLNEVYWQLGEWSRFVDSAGAEAVMETDADRKAVLYERIAQVRAEYLSQEPEARRALEDALAAAPWRRETRIRLAQGLRADKEPAKAIQVLLAGIEIEEDARTLQTFLATAAQIAIVDQEDFTKAREFLKRSLMMNDPQSPHRETSQQIFSLAFLQGQSILDDPSLLYLYRAYEEAFGEGEHAAFYYRYAICLLPKKEHGAKRLELLQKAVELDPENVAASRLLGEDLFDRENWLEALVVWSRTLGPEGIQNHPDIDLVRKIARAAGALERFEVLLPAVRRSVELGQVPEEELLSLLQGTLRGSSVEVEETLRSTLDLIVEGAGATQSSLFVALCAYLVVKVLGAKEQSAPEKIRRYRLASESAPMPSVLRGAALYELGLLFAELGQRHQAVKALEEVMEIYRQTEGRPAAEENLYFVRLSKIIRIDLPDRLTLHRRLADLHEAADFAKAAEHYWEVYQADPADEEILGKLKPWYTHQEDWEKLERLLVVTCQHLEGDRQAGTRRLDALRELAQVRLKQRKDAAGARQIYERILVESPEDEEAHDLLAGLYAQGEVEHEKAIREHEWLLAKDPLRLDSWRSLLVHLLAIGEQHRAGLLSQAMVLLGEAQGEDRQRAEAAQARSLLFRQGTISRDARDRFLLTALQKEYLGELFRLLTPGLEKVYPFKLERYGLTKADRIDRDSPSEVRALLERANGILKAFGGDEFALYWDRKGQNRFVLENDKKPTLVLSSDILPMFSEIEQDFLVGRAVQYVLDGCMVLQKVKASKMDRTLHALLKIIDPKNAVVVGREELEDTQQTASKMSRRVKKDIQPLLERHADPERRIEFLRWFDAVQATTNRGGFLACRSFPDAVRFLMKEAGGNPKSGPDEVRRQIREGKPIADLFLYVASHQYVEMARLLYDL